MPKSKDYARFIKFVDKNGKIVEHLTEPCWEWKGAIDKYGRPRFWLDHSNELARRAVYLLEGKQPPPVECIIALCLNPRCVKPGHLTLGTEEDAQAMTMLGPQSRFYSGDLCLIRKVVADGEATVEYMAEAYDISVELVEQIITME